MRGKCDSICIHAYIYIYILYICIYIISNLYCSMYINVYIYTLFMVAICKSMYAFIFDITIINCFGFFPSARRIISPHPMRAHLIASDDTLTSLKTLVKKRFSLSKSQNVTSSLWEMTPTAHCVSIQQMVSLSTQLVKFCGWLLAIWAFASLVLNRSTWNFGICFSFLRGKTHIYTII